MLIAVWHSRDWALGFQLVCQTLTGFNEVGVCVPFRLCVIELGNLVKYVKLQVNDLQQFACLSLCVSGKKIILINCFCR